jgi:DNA-binding winged helix-turn-helix (wHTH) protein
VRETNEPGLSFHPSARRVVRFGPYRVDLSDGSLWRGTEDVRMPPRALAVLLYLVERPGRLVSKSALLDAVWKDAHVSETSLTEAMGLVRQTLGDNPQQPEYIQTVHRRGYRFIAPISVEPQAGVSRGVPDAAEELEPHAPVSSAPEPDSVRHTRAASRTMVVAAAIALALAAAATWAWTRPDSTPAVTRATITLLPEQAPAPALGAHTVMALSPDGQQMVYVAGTSGEYQLFARRMDQFEARPLAGTRGGHGPFFAPDGLRIGFFADGKLKHLALAGGEPVTIADAPAGLGAWWTDRRTIIFAPEWTGGLWEIEDRGGSPHEVVKAPSPSVGYRWPQLLPDGDTIIATRWGTDRRDAAVVGLSRSRAGESQLASGATYGRFLAPGHVLFVRDTTLEGASYRPGDKTPGTARPVLERVMTGSTGAAQFSLSRTGSLIYIPHDPDRSNRALARVDPAGNVRPTAHEARAFQNLTACGDKLAVTILDRGASDLWTASASGGAFTRLTESGTVIEPVWRPGCEEVAYTKGGEMYLQRADRSGSSRRLQESAVLQAPASWTPDGAQLVYLQVAPDTKSDLWILNLADGKHQPLVVSPATESAPRVSPDGRWLAYVSNETGRWEIYLKPFQRPGGAVRVSLAGGSAPAWSSDGRTLHYRRGNKIVWVPVDTVRGPVISSDERVLDRPDMLLFRPLGADFIIVQRLREHLPLTTLNLVINWSAEIGQRLSR